MVTVAYQVGACESKALDQHGQSFGYLTRKFPGINTENLETRIFEGLK